jgi:glycine amidinotransferase
VRISQGRMIVNSWNEWDPLRRVIVGRIATDMVGAPDPGAVFTFPDAEIKAGEWHAIPQDVYQTAREQMEAFVTMLQGKGIQVDRPTLHEKFNQKISTPDWEHDWTFGIMPPRDILLCQGNEILESTMSARSRWYEYICYRPLLETYFREDPSFVWEAAPKPRLTEETYEKGYWENYHNVWSEEEKMARMRDLRWQLTDKEPLFDAADFFRFGKDLFVQHSAVTNRPGIDWLKRHFEPKGFRVHDVAFGGTPQPWHFDCTIIPLRPGLLIQNPDWMPLTPEFHELFRINDWEIVMAAPPTRPNPHAYSFCSTNLAYNVFSLDPDTVCVEAGEGQLMDQLDGLGFEVVPVDYFEVSPFGGGLHCSTVDIYRQGDCEDYFPKQIEGF